MRAITEGRLPWQGPARNRLRTGFMMAGVIVGIGALTVLDSISEGTRRDTLKRFQNMLGTFDTVIIRPGAARTRGMVSLTNVPPTLTFEDAAAVAAEIKMVKQVAEVQNAFDIDVKYRDRTDSPAVFGVSANWPDLRGDQVADGAFLTDDDVRSLARVAILGADVVTRLFPGERPIGQTVRIGDVPFQVKGVLTARGAGPGGASLDHVILIPVTTASKRLFNRDFLTMVIAQLREPEQSDAAVNSIRALLRQRHRLADSALDDFSLSNPRAVMAQVTQIGSTLTASLKGIAIVGLVIAGVVITGLMVMSVSERRVEIGVRRSVGASREDILRQFLLEAVLVTCLGGLIGTAVALGGISLVATLQKLPPVIAWNALGEAAGLSIGLGLIFGLYPAWRAAQVDPVKALRT